MNEREIDALLNRLAGDSVRGLVHAQIASKAFSELGDELNAALPKMEDCLAKIRAQSFARRLEHCRQGAIEAVAFAPDEAWALVLGIVDRLPPTPGGRKQGGVNDVGSGVEHGSEMAGSAAAVPGGVRVRLPGGDGDRPAGDELGAEAIPACGVGSYDPFHG